MLILAGVAFPEWDTDSGKLGHKTLVVKLGATTTPAFQATSSLALAAIDNTDSDFIFAADDSTVAVGDDGELELHADLGLMGDRSVLLRVGYHVQVLSDPLESFVSGTIRWAESWGDPRIDAQTGQSPAFRVSAGRIVQDTPGGGQFPTTHWLERANAWSGTPQHVNGMWAAAYVLRGLPLNEQLNVNPQLQSGAIVRPLDGLQPFFEPSRSVQLSLAVPALTGVDFELTFRGGPR